MEDNTASECIRTVAVKYGCKILQLYECKANEDGFGTHTFYEGGGGGGVEPNPPP